MRRREDFPLRKHTLNLFDGDFARLQELHPRLGAAKAVREIVRAHIKRAEERAAQRATPLETDEDIDI